jgi:hypothetical protein
MIESFEEFYPSFILAKLKFYAIIKLIDKNKYLKRNT